MDSLMHATCFKKAFDLGKAGKWDEALELLRDLQDEYVALWEENRALKQQLCEVADILDLAENMHFDGQKYWLDVDGRREGPYCQLCYDKEGQMVRLQEQDRHWQCRGCGNLYMKRKLREATVREDTPPTRLLKSPIPLFVK
ncbi:MAG: hypothetical protein V3573_10670 [Desulfovibrionaceae bacterium]